MIEEKEEWKSVQDYESCYEISNLGRVKSLSRILKNNQFKKELIRTGGIDNKGYYSIILSKDGKNKRMAIHRLIALHFIDNPEDKCCINHIDGNRVNNSLSNLEWVTLTENARHAYDTGLINHESLRERGVLASEKRRIKTEQYSKDNNLIAVYNSFKEASDSTGIARESISAVCKGKYKTAGGYLWKVAS
jgi:hypothetical protein